MKKKGKIVGNYFKTPEGNIYIYVLNITKIDNIEHIYFVVTYNEYQGNPKDIIFNVNYKDHMSLETLKILFKKVPFLKGFLMDVRRKKEEWKKE